MSRSRQGSRPRRGRRPQVAEAVPLDVGDVSMAFERYSRALADAREGALSRLKEAETADGLLRKSRDITSEVAEELDSKSTGIPTAAKPSGPPKGIMSSLSSSLDELGHRISTYRLFEETVSSREQWVTDLNRESSYRDFLKWRKRSESLLPDADRGVLSGTKQRIQEARTAILKELGDFEKMKEQLRVKLQQARSRKTSAIAKVDDFRRQLSFTRAGTVATAGWIFTAGLIISCFCFLIGGFGGCVVGACSGDATVVGGSTVGSVGLAGISFGLTLLVLFAQVLAMSLVAIGRKRRLLEETKASSQMIEAATQLEKYADDIGIR